MSEITLSVLRCPDAVVPGQRRATGGEISLGRAAECDWPLADPDRVLSKRHCVLEFFGGGWQVRDLSTNGTFVNHAEAPVGRDQIRPLRDGDRLRLGAYEIEVRIAEAADQPGWGGAPDPFANAPPSQGFGGASLPGFGAPAGSGFNAPPGQDFGTPPGQDFGAPPGQDFGAPPGQDFGAPPGQGFGAPPGQGFGAPPGQGGGGLLPDDFDPFGPAEQQGPMPDHAPSTAEAFMVPPSLPAGKALIPDDWDLDLTPARPAAPPPAAPTPRPTPPPAVDPFAADPFGAPAANPFAPAPPTPIPSAPMPSAPMPAAPQPPAPPAPPPRDPFLETDDAFRALPAAVPHVPPAQSPAPAMPAPGMPALGMPAPDSAASLAALLDGAGLPPQMAAQLAAQNPDAALRAAGAVLRAAITGIRALLIARADVKREFRIEQTMLRAANNNPLKFAATEDQALAALLDPRSPALAAVQETVEDLTAHQVATLAATQAAVRALLERLAPASIEADDPGGGLLPGAKEKRLWDSYRRRHGLLVEQFEDDFDSAFGKAFARAYEQATTRRER